MPFSLLVVLYFVISVIEIFENSISKKVLAAIALFPAFFLTAFRDYTVGNDTVTYLICYERIAHINSLFEALSYDRMETGYVALSYYFSHIGLSFYQFQFIIAFFIYFSLYLFLVRYSKNIGISCLMFLTLRYMLGPMVVVRMYIVVAILLYSVPYIQLRKFPHFLFLVVLATFFHKTALLFLPLYPLSIVKWSKEKILVATCASAIIAFLGKTFFLYVTSKVGIYENYLDGAYFASTGKTSVIVRLAIDSILAMFVLYTEWLYKKQFDIQNIIEKNRISIQQINHTAILCILCLDIIGLSNSIMGRISGYFTFSWLIIVPMVFSQIKNKASSFVLFVPFAVFLIAYFETILVLRQDWYNVIPYHFYFGSIF